MFKYVYVCNPLDFFENHQYRTVGEILELYDFEECDIVKKCNFALKIFKEHFHEEFRGGKGLMITSVMEEYSLKDVIIAKADNNGTTYIFTDAELKMDCIYEVYRIEEKYFLYKEIKK